MRKQRSGKGWNWRIVFSEIAIFKMKTVPLILILCLIFSPVVLHAEGIKHVTVNDYLQQARAQGKKANHLLNETSPYLLQHAYNPVNWYAWGEAAFEKAKKENKPIFLSIGYSTCHWCHVMAHESFENKKIAALLNKYFVSIKVDREQRPDIDAVYMSATQLINGNGGWPMTVFLDNKLRPFHAATYYPPFTIDGRLGLKDVLLGVHDLWLKQPDKIASVAASISEKITALADETTQDSALQDDVVPLALKQISEEFDEELGGFSAAPKFPRPGIFSLLNNLPGNKTAQHMMRVTLDAMAAGGIYDQIAGGFHRYSVDARWQVPHFEKMLYSQALMVMAYNDFYRIDTRARYKQVIYQTLNFVRAEMQSPAGAFYSALDADSERADKPGEHAEGAYYLWGESELEYLLSKDEFALVKKYFGINKNGNIISDPRNEFINLNILAIDEEYKNKTLTHQQSKRLASATSKLNKQRLLRPRPHLDDKVITAWNGMMLVAFAKASVTFDDSQLLDAAIDTAGFIKQHLYDAKDKKLFRQYRLAEANTQATLADYVWLIYGLLEIYHAKADVQWLHWALELQAQQNALFFDQVSGAYFESVASDSRLLFRSKSIYDDALPSANAIALANLRELSRLPENTLQKKSLATQADKLVGSFAAAVNQNPAAAASLLAVEVKPEDTSN